MSTETNVVPMNATPVDLDATLAAMAAPATTPVAPAAVTPVAATPYESPKKRRGRPPGSKNKKTAEKAASAEPKRRGRPPGSKNKPKVGRPAKKAVAKAEPKRRGRPPGSKNKKTLAAPKVRKTKRVAGVKAQAQIAKELNRRFVQEAKEQKLPLSIVIRQYIYKGAKYSPEGA